MQTIYEKYVHGTEDRNSRVGYYLSCTKKMYYYTPRALLMEYLNDERWKHIAQWIVKDVAFVVIDRDKMERIWKMYTVCVRPPDGPNELWNARSHHGLELISTTNRLFDVSDVRLLAMKSTDERYYYINDLEKGPLSESLVLFLLEKSRTDWITWLDIDKKEFQILDIEGLGEVYMEINGMGTWNLTMFKMILDSLCINDVLIEINPHLYIYRFNSTWFEKEIMKPPRQSFGFIPPDIFAY